MNKPVAVSASLLTAELRERFSIVNVKAESPHFVRFRLDPGPVFERIGIIYEGPSGGLNLTIGQRYQPGELPTWLATHRCPPRAGALADNLRELRSWANEWDIRPDWRAAVSARGPGWTARIPGTGPDAVRDARQQATSRAAETGTAHFVWNLNGRQLVISGTLPPMGETWSVNESGEWSVHRAGTDPLDSPPSADKPPRPIRAGAVELAAQDLGEWKAATMRPTGPEPPAPVASPAAARHGRGR
jgi:hypothetical protein